MDFGLNEDQEMLQRSAAEFLAARVPAEFVREVATRDEEAFRARSIARWRSSGWMGLVVPEAYGGAELKLLDLALLARAARHGAGAGPVLLLGSAGHAWRS